MFDAALREEWLAGDADAACRKWRVAHPERVHWFDTDNRHYRLDIDTPDDLERFSASTGHTLQWPAALAPKRWRRRSGRTMPSLRLTAARACAWALLIAGWVGVGSFALAFAPGMASGFALVALWLLALGAAAHCGHWRQHAAWLRGAALMRDRRRHRGGLWSAAHGGGLVALGFALLGWSALTALASGVVRSLRLAHRVTPAPPIAAAALGALCAGLVLGDVGDVIALGLRLGLFVVATAALLVALQHGAHLRPRAPGCRAGLFDCSLPAWPMGAWREPVQWPTLLAGLAMLPMMAALPWMAAWCRAQSVPPQAMVLLHLAAMFGPVLLLRALDRLVVAAPPVGGVRAAAGASAPPWSAWAPAPFDLLGLALAHGAAWGVAWGGQLWAPARRGQQGTSPLRAALGYALLTLLSVSWWSSSARAASQRRMHCSASPRQRPGCSAHRPGPLRGTQLLVRPRHLQHTQIVVPVADDLQPDRQARRRVAAVDRRRRLLAHVVRQRERDVLERPLRVVERARPTRRHRSAPGSPATARSRTAGTRATAASRNAAIWL